MTLLENITTPLSLCKRVQATTPSLDLISIRKACRIHLIDLESTFSFAIESHVMSYLDLNMNSPLISSALLCCQRSLEVPRAVSLPWITITVTGGSYRVAFPSSDLWGVAFLEGASSLLYFRTRYFLPADDSIRGR